MFKWFFYVIIKSYIIIKFKIRIFILVKLVNYNIKQLYIVYIQSNRLKVSGVPTKCIKIKPYSKNIFMCIFNYVL